VSVSEDGQTYELIQSITGDDPAIELATATFPVSTYVQFVGAGGQMTIDALEALQTACPATVR
jgi:hypothetical protein